MEDLSYHSKSTLNIAKSSHPRVSDSQFHRQATSALVANIVAVLSLAIGSFTRQAIKTIACDLVLPNFNAFFPLVDGSLSSIVTRYGAGIYDLDASTKAGIFKALTDPSVDRSTLMQGCPTGNCTFPDVSPRVTHTTSGFRSKYVDTSRFVLEEYYEQA